MKNCIVADLFDISFRSLQKFFFWFRVNERITAASACASKSDKKYLLQI